MSIRSEKARRNIEARVYRDCVGAPPEPKWKTLLALLTEQGFAVRVIRKRLKLPTPLNTTDRTVLEQQIFPHFLQKSGVRDVLFVGCNTYTAHYQRKFFSGVNFITLEPDPSLARFGATPRHVVAPLEELATHLPPASLDLIICNGVFGWGLDRLEQCEAAFEQCYTRLRDGGFLVHGWDDIPQRVPIDIDRVQSLARFRKYTLPAFGTWRYVTATAFRHTFDFYQK